MDKQRLMFAIGVIAGEGGFTGDKRKPRLSVKQKENVRLLEYLVSVLGGRIHGEYKYTPADGTERRYHVWALDGPALESALPHLMQMPPCHKRDQMLAWRSKYGI